jgi:hypothetical protein
MSGSRGVLRSVGSVVLLVATALGLYNVYSDDSDVQALAKKVACADRPCEAKLARQSRSPLSESFTFETELTDKARPHRSASVDVECRRALYLIGEYTCTAQGALPP